MERKQAYDFPQELLDIFDLFVHGDIDRRQFLDRAKKFAVGGVTAAALLESLSPNFAWAQQIEPDDSRITTSRVTVQSPEGNGTIDGYLVRPAKSWEGAPGVLVVHENRGLNPYIEDVARRLGTEGYLTFAPDGLTSVGGYPGDEDEGRRLFREVDRQKMANDFVAAASYLMRPQPGPKLGVVGFCFGGGVSNNLAVRLGDYLSAAVPFYGSQPSAEDTAKIKAPLLIQYASLDERINARWSEYKTALDANNVPYTMHMYEGANHGFHNDTTPRYDEAAATLAWDRTLAFFAKHLRA
jgi:carboxymethylenebutenolidase